MRLRIRRRLFVRTGPWCSRVSHGTAQSDVAKLYRVFTLSGSSDAHRTTGIAAIARDAAGTASAVAVGMASSWCCARHVGQKAQWDWWNRGRTSVKRSHITDVRRRRREKAVGIGRSGWPRWRTERQRRNRWHIAFSWYWPSSSRYHCTNLLLLLERRWHGRHRWWWERRRHHHGGCVRCRSRV